MLATESMVTRPKLKASGAAVCLFVLVGVCVFCGCSGVYIGAPKSPGGEDLAATYYSTRVNKSLTLDVLPRIEAHPQELLSRSENIVASVGQSKDGYKTWFTMVAFHEYTVAVIRKYFYYVDEKVGAGPRVGMRFDCEIALDNKTMQRPYTDQNARRIAMLRHALATLRADIDELRRAPEAPGQNNQKLNICAMLIKQVFDTVLRKMEGSPVLASRLHEPAGVEFDHLTFNKGRIGMVVEDDVARVKVRLGAFVNSFEEPPVAPGPTAAPTSPANAGE
ncbi:MAG: hypothetical protein JSU94_19765 [Phycisphaerales bacterium]|nr:MAG: hypothetical protein JSU94_19765 [Phycisphaerales bacterium]